ncbi:hypothetical protein KKA33_04560 [Patescibacteria group bacterium]|nr:hypothetical protein [Patescibacteria group bacterium]
MKKITLFTSIILSILLLTACGEDDNNKPVLDDFSESAGEEWVERIIGGDEAHIDIDFDVEEGGDGISWPESIPSEYMKFTEGKIEIVMGDFNTGDGVMLQLIEIEEGGIEEYLSGLKKSGWEIERFEEEEILLKAVAVKGNLEISFDIDPIGPRTAFLWLK